MRKLLSRFIKNTSLNYDEDGVCVYDEQRSLTKISWLNISKIIFVGFFEEYSGYFLTDDFKGKKQYAKIFFDGMHNTVKVRTTGSPSVKKNASEPFKIPHGTTNITKVIFIEYLDVQGNKNIYAVHYSDGKKEELVNQLKVYLTEKKVFIRSRLDGFGHIPSLR